MAGGNVIEAACRVSLALVLACAAERRLESRQLAATLEQNFASVVSGGLKTGVEDSLGIKGPFGPLRIGLAS